MICSKYKLPLIFLYQLYSYRFNIPRMSLSHSITLNNVTAILDLSGKLDNNNNQIDWKISLNANNNCSTTSGIFTIESPVCNNEEKNKHQEIIRDMLNKCEHIIGKENKARYIIKILDYISGDALNFTNSYEHFKNTVINKCYEFKKINSDMVDIVKKANEVLIKLGVSTIIPNDFKLNNINNYIRNYRNTTIKTPKYDIDLALFTVIAKKYNHSEAIKNPDEEFRYFEDNVERGIVKGHTKAEQMVDYFNKFSEDSRKIELMKKIFAKHHLIFNDVAMILYYEWNKNYIPKYKINRYDKMNEFAIIHKNLFTV